ncbi:hypothetical protein ACH4SP_05435 [Streptomyces sp. NPDC021093]|uniref:hypothetical protein n=1 Tax=Streptomyces sp. NPDC021093 TaxID=3365112 RepID=UPI0037B57F70
MRRIRFESASVPKACILTELDEFRESLFALELLGRNAGGQPFQRWRRSVVRHRAVRDLVTMAQTIRPFPDMDNVVQRARPGTPAADRTHEPMLVRDLREFHRIAVAPYRIHLDRVLDADRAARRRIAVTQGPEKLLSTLHSSIRWSAPVLEVCAQQGEDMTLDAGGLLLSPSIFLSPLAPRVLHRAAGPDTPTLFYPVPMEQSWRMPAYLY